MNDDQRTELSAMRAEHRALKARLGLLEARLERLELGAAVVTPPVPVPVPVPVVPRVPVPVPPPLPPVVPSLPPVVPPAAEAPGPVSIPVLAREDKPPAAAGESLEMRIGTTWLARAGVVLLLTSLAFFGNYFYHHIVPHLRPVAKVSLFYLAAGALTGVGAWLERSRAAREQPRLRDYARVVFAGGLAAVYYVTYAAHWNPQLRVVASPFLDGGLLLGWAAFMVFLADRRGSELLATFAILLAYYTSAINEITSFTLVSNALLTVAAVFLLRRHLWRVFPFASVLATYGSYGFWRYFHAYAGAYALPGGGGLPLRSSLPTGGFWPEAAFLLLYWTLFTWAVFTAGEGVLSRWRRAGFVTVNNGAFFLLSTWALLAEYPGTFWKWSLGFGVALLALTEVCRRWPTRLDADTENAYLVQGLLLVTLGFINYFSGWQLALVLAVQSAFLVLGAGQRASVVLLAAGAATALLSFLYGVPRIGDARWITGLAEGGFLVFNAWQGQQQREKARPDRPAGAWFAGGLSVAPGYFSLLGLATWFWLIEKHVTVVAAQAPVFAVAAVLLTASVYLLRVRAVPFYAQAYLLAAYGHWIFSYALDPGSHVGPPVWNPLILLAATLAIGHWWQRQPGAVTAGRVGSAWTAGFAVGLLYLWLRPWPGAPDDVWVAETALLSLVVLAYGLFTRWRALAVAGQLLLAASVMHFLHQWEHPWFGFGPEMWLALAPLLAVLATLVIGRRYLTDRAGSLLAGGVGTAYEIAATALFLAWGNRYFPSETRFTLFCAAGALVLGLGCVFRQKRWMVLSIAPTLAGLIVFLAVYEREEQRNLLHLLGISCLAAEQQFGRRRLGEAVKEMFPAPAQAALMTAATVCAWVFLSVRMLGWHGGDAFTLAASWSLFAPLVFAAGLALHERIYRWLALLILGVTLGRILLFDIWQLDFLGQAVTFLCLGVVVLVLGFVYNRFQAKFREIF